MKIKLLLFALLFSVLGWGQVLIPNTTAVTQNFNGIGTTATATLPSGFKVNTTKDYTTGTTLTTQVAGTTGAGVLTGASSGGVYNFANGVTSTSTDRSIGFLSTGTFSSPKSILFAIQNTNTSTMTDLSITFDYENYRTGTRAFDWTFFHGATATLINTADAAGNQSYISTGTNAVINPPNSTSKTVTLTGLSIPANGLYYLCWTYTGSGGSTNAQGLGLDNLSITAGFGVASTITTNTSISGSPFCVSASTGIAVSVPFTITGSYTSGNVFTAQLSNSLGSFASPTNIGTLTGTVAGTISGTIPAGTPSGTGYIIRVVSNTPSITGSDNTSNLIVNLTNVSIAPTTIQNIAVATNGATLTVTENPVATSRQWFYSTVSGGPYSNSIASATATTYVPNLASAGNYYVVCVTTSACGTITSNEVLVNVTLPAPEINVKGVISLNPTILDGTVLTSGLNNTLFSTVLVGGNQAKVFRIENTGSLSLRVSSISFVGGNAGDFVASGVVFPLVIATGTFQDFTVTFSPTAVGARTTTININSDDIDEAIYNFNLKGTGTNALVIDINLKGNSVSIPDNSLFPTGLNFTAFGIANVGSTTVTRVFTVENLGVNNLTLTGVPLVSISGFNASSFSVSVLPTSDTITGGSSLTFSVKFDPTSLGTKNATINILSNDNDETLYNFNISGTAKGVNNIYVSGNNNTILKGATTTSILNNTNFGGVSIAGNTSQNSFTITNLSTASVTISNVVISGTDSGLFSVVLNPSINAVVAGSSTSFVINFAPTTVGQKNAIATFTTTDSTDSTFSFAISGIGETYIPCTIGAVQTIAIQDFEDVPATPTWAYTNATDGTVNIAGGTFALPTVVNGFLGAKALQFNSATNGSIATNIITLNPVDTSQYANINMSMKVAALIPGSGSGAGLDIVDYIQIETSVDNGVNWSAEAKLAGYSNSRWGFDASGVFDAFYSGTNNGASIDTRLGNAELPAGIATYNLKFLPASTNLLIRISMVIDRINEIWAIDNIKIEGQIPVSSTWNGVMWTPSAPTTSTKAIIDGTYNVGTEGNITACECQVKLGKTLNINTGIIVSNDASIEIQSNIFNEGIINIENNASLIQINNSATNSGSGTTNVTRTTPNFDKYDYTYWSSPIKDDNIGTRLSAWNQDYMFNYKTENFSDTSNDATYPQTNGLGADNFDDNNNDWVKIASPTATTMSPGVGYAVMGDTTGAFPRTETVTFSGVVNNGIIPFSLKQSANTVELLDDYNLVGNPYPSSIKADDFINANISPTPNITGTLYFWTHGGSLQPAATNPGPNINNYNANEYALYNLTGSTVTATAAGSTGSPISAVPNGFIGTGQAFLVEAVTTNDLIFNNSMRNKNHSNSQFFRPNKDVQKDRLWLNFANIDQMFSQQLIGYLPETTLDFDYGYDGIESKSQNFVSFYSFTNQPDGINFKIQSRNLFNQNDEVKLGFFSAVSGQSSIAIDHFEGEFNNQNIFLQDNLLNIIHDLKQSAYSFTTNYGMFNDRFVLKYINTFLANDTFVNAENAVLISTKDSKILVASNKEKIKSVQVFDLLGRNIYDNQSVNTKSIATDNLAIKNQVLIVKTKLENGEVVTKKIML